MKAKEQILTRSLREVLKETMQTEIENLPTILAALHPIDRIGAICKIMPFIFPKIETIAAADGEPLQW